MQPTDTYPADAYPAGSDPMSYPAYPDYPETPTYPAYADYPGSPTYMATSGYQGYPGVDYPTVHGWATAAQSAAAGIPEGLAPDYSASFITAIRRTIQRPLRFRGMASRREFWFSYLAAVMFSFATLLPTVLIVSWAEEAMDTPPISMQLLACRNLPQQRQWIMRRNDNHGLTNIARAQCTMNRTMSDFVRNLYHIKLWNAGIVG